jgi:sulfide dehydrogenase cytochrome subunit
MLILSALGVRTVVAADVSRAEALADACTSCHGVKGHSSGFIPSLDTLPRAKFLQAMEGFREPGSSATIMNRIVRTYTRAEIELLADYFSMDGKR